MNQTLQAGAEAGPAPWIAPPARARSRTALAVMLAASVAVHAVVALAVFSRPQDAEIAGGAPVGATVLGNAFEDALSMGEVSETIAPVEQSETAEAIAPSQVEAVAPADAVTAPPVDTAAAQPAQSLPSSPSTPPLAASPAETTPTQSTAQSVIVAPATPAQPTPEAESPPEAAAIAPDEQEPVVAQTEAPPPQGAQTPVETAEALAPEPDPVADVPLPTPRPEYTPPPRQAERAPAPQQPAAPRQAQAPSGNRGNQAADQRRGASDGQASGQSAAAAQRQAAATAAGNAAVSNYPGQIVSRLRRALRYPSAARRERATGEVHVSFSVNANGGVSAVRIARSSGYAVLDEAAVATVQRAAPFPAIPAGAGRSSWAFSVPLAFSR